MTQCPTENLAIIGMLHLILCMEDPDWEFYNHPSMLNQRVTKCADALFPYGGKSWQDWCEAAMRRCLQDGVSPETLRDKRLGSKNIVNRRKITKVLYY